MEVVVAYEIKFLDGRVQEFDTLVGVDLYGANLKRADLRGVDLEGADLRRADLRGADLEGANLRGANLGGADLGGADLRGADLGGVNLGVANLRRADLRGANLGGANLYGADLRGADLRGANLYGVNLTFTKGIMSATLGKHLAVAFVFEERKYVKIGCKTLTVEEWLSGFEDIGRAENYSDIDIKLYVSFIKFISTVPLNIFKA